MRFVFVMAVAMVGSLLFGQGCMRRAFRNAEGEGWREWREHETGRDRSHREPAKGGAHKNSRLLENPEYTEEQ